VKGKTLATIALIQALWLASVVPAPAQTGWPDEKKPAVTQTSPGGAPKTTPQPKRHAASTRPGARKAVVESEALRTMSAIIAGQTLAIEALTIRLEAAERRLGMSTVSVPEPVADDLSDPFRAARVVDWTQVVGELVR
jgi:hypothetical protein